jgi:hypothetical protein
VGNKVDIEVTARNNAKAALADARKDVADLGDEAKRTGVKLADLNAASDRAGTGAKRMGSDFDSAKEDAKQLGRELLALKAEMSAIGREISGTKINAPSITNGGRKSTGSVFGFTMAEIERFGGDAGVTFGKAMQGGILDAAGDAFKALPAEVKLAALGAGAVIGVALAGAIGASANAAVLGGTGAAGIAGALIAQAKDPRVTATWGASFDRIVKMWTQVTTPFAKPMIYSAAVLEKAFSGVIRTIQPELNDLSGLVVELASGAGSAFKNMGPGLAKALEAAKPILDALAKELPHFGEVVGQAFADMSEGSEGAVYGLRTVFKIAETGITTFATLVKWLSIAYETFIDFSSASNDFAASMLGWVPVLGPYIQTVADKLHQIKDGGEAAGDGLDAAEQATARAGEAADKAASYWTDLLESLTQVTPTAATVAGAMTDKLLDAMLGVEHNAIDFEQSLDDMSESLKKNGKNFDIHSQKGRDNMLAILGVVESNKKIYDTMIAGGSTVEEATKMWDINTDALRKQLKQAGLTDKKIDELIGTYTRVPGDVNTDIRAHGVEDAINNLARLIGEINGIPLYKVFTMKMVVTGAVDTIMAAARAQFHASGGIQTAASGGMRSDLTWVGEQGPELVRLPSGSQVFTAGQSERMARQGWDGASSGADGYTIHNTITLDGKVVGQAMTSLSRKGDLKIHQKSIV